MNSINYQNKTINPSKIICIGRNYVDHIEELGNETPDSMVVFNKTNSSISDELLYFSEDTRYEGEICFLIQEKKIKAVGFGLDLTQANLQNKLKAKGLPWERSKTFNGAAVLSDFVELDGDISTLSLELFINKELKQIGNHDLMIYKPKEMLTEIESFMSFEDGDIIMSGTPKGVGTYKKGDIFEGKIYLENKLLLKKTWIVK